MLLSNTCRVIKQELVASDLVHLIHERDSVTIVDSSSPLEVGFVLKSETVICLLFTYFEMQNGVAL